MSDAVVTIILVASILAGLLLIPFGLPGLWLMVVAVVGCALLTGFRTAGALTVGVVVGLAAVGEIAETWLGFRFARRYGGSSRAGWGALLGGLVGAVVGVPVPLLGSIIGAFLGSFAGAALFEYTVSRHPGVAASAGWGAVLGRAAAAGVKTALGLVIGVVALFAAR